MSIWVNNNDEEGSEDEKEKVKNNPFQNKKKNYKSDSESASSKNILKRKDEKLLDTINEQSKKLKEHLENNNFEDIFECYFVLSKLASQINSVFEEPPQRYLKCLCLIDKKVNALTKEEKAKLTQNNNKHYNILKKNLLKDKLFQEEIKAFRETHDSEDELSDM